MNLLLVSISMPVDRQVPTGIVRAYVSGYKYIA